MKTENSACEKIGLGPLLTDTEFFTQCLDPACDDLKQVIQCAQQGDYKKARSLFAANVRRNLQPDRYLTVEETNKKMGKGSTSMYDGEDYVAAADRACRHELISCAVPCQFGDTVDWFANPTYNKYKEWTWQLSRHADFIYLAHAYLETGDEKYARTYAQLAQSWMRQAVRPEPCSGGDTLCWRTIECGIRMGGSWQYSFHVFYKLMSDDFIVDWYKSVYEHGQRLYRDHRSGNWLIMEMNGLANIGILYPQFATAALWKTFALDTLAKELQAQIYPDGFQYELSTNYHAVVIINYAKIMLVAKAYDVPVPKVFTDTLENVYELYIKLMQPDTVEPDINDGFNRPCAHFLESSRHFYPDNPQFRWILSDKKEGSAPAYCSVALPYSGMLAMRTGWDEDATYGFFDGGPFGRGHQHEDKLNFLLYADRHYYLTEGGVYAYDTSPLREYVLSTRAHNTAMVNGLEQNRRKNYSWQSEDIAKKADFTYRVEDGFDYGCAAYDEGYGPQAQRLARHERSVLFIKKPQNGLRPFFIVTDRFYAQQTNRYELQWHIDCKKLTAEQLNVTADTLHVLTSVRQRQDNAGLQLYYGSRGEKWQGWVASSMTQGDCTPVYTPVWNVEGDNVRVVTVFYPDGGLPCGLTGVEAANDPACKAFTLLFADGTRQTLCEDDYR